MTRISSRHLLDMLLAEISDPATRSGNDTEPFNLQFWSFYRSSLNLETAPTRDFGRFKL